MTPNRFFMTCTLLLVATIVGTAAPGPDGWSEREIDELRSLSLHDLEPLAPDPTNRFADDARAATFGERLFFDTRLSANGVIEPAAATAWLAMSDGEREAVTRVFVNMGKAIAAFERRIEFGASRFDRYVDALSERRRGDGILTKDEVAGLKLFIGRGHCTQCHNGPLLTNNEFHNTGVPPRADLAVDAGRLTGAAAVLRDEFNCRSPWSDAPERCPELEFLITGDHELQRAYKVPSLRNVAGRAPYMNAGQFATLADVLRHYNRAPALLAGHTELRPLGLKPAELGQLEAFLRALSGPLVVNGGRMSTCGPAVSASTSSPPDVWIYCAAGASRARATISTASPTRAATAMY